MSGKRIIILPKAAAQEIVRKSVQRVAGGHITIGATVTLRDVGVRSRDDLLAFRKLVAVELAKTAPKGIGPTRFARHLEIRPSHTGKQLLVGLQKAYSLGLSGDVIPPDDDD